MFWSSCRCSGLEHMRRERQANPIGTQMMHGISLWSYSRRVGTLAAQAVTRDFWPIHGYSYCSEHLASRRDTSLGAGNLPDGFSTLNANEESMMGESEDAICGSWWGKDQSGNFGPGSGFRAYNANV